MAPTRALGGPYYYVPAGGYADMGKPAYPKHLPKEYTMGKARKVGRRPRKV